MDERDQVVVDQLAFHAQYKIEQLRSQRCLLLGQGSIGLGHAQQQKILERHRVAVAMLQPSQQVMEELHIVISKIDPLRNRKHQRRRQRLVLCKRRQLRARPIQKRKPVADAPLDQCLVEFFEDRGLSSGPHRNKIIRFGREIRVSRAELAYLALGLLDLAEQ
jgi:hypothetical protein